MKKTAVITDYGFANLDPERSIIEDAGFQLIEGQCKTEDEVIALAEYADVVLAQWAPVSRRVISSLKKCSLIVRYGIGVDNIDLQAARDFRIPVCNVPDYCIDEVAAHTLALALALQRRLLATDQRVRSGTWKIIPPGPVLPTDESNFVLLGFGRIAQSVAWKAAALGYRLAACDPFVDEKSMRAVGVKKVGFEQALNQADVLSLHLPLTEETRHAIDRHTLAKMKRDAVVVNTSRGALIHTTDLAEALSSGIIGGAGIDVFEHEPLDNDHPLRLSPNTILTSHTAWYSERSIPLLQRLAAEEVLRGLTGQPLKNRLV